MRTEAIDRWEKLKALDDQRKEIERQMERLLGIEIGNDSERLHSAFSENV